MTSRPAPRLLVVLLALAVLTGLRASPVVAAQADPATDPAVTPVAAAPGKVRGTVVARGADLPDVDVLWFAPDWTYLGRAVALGGAYTLTLPPGQYYLQFVDRAPAYDTDRLAPTDATVVVASNATTVRNVKMRKGGAIGGVVTANGKPAKKARVVAANTYEQSFETMTDKTGSYALGGLPAGTYSVFVYDRKFDRVGKSTFVRKVKKGSFRQVSPSLSKRAGSLVVDLYAGGQPVGEQVFLTAVSVKTGQFWTVPSAGGVATFRGLYPGAYRIVAPARGAFPAQTQPVVGGVVKAGRASFGSFTWLP